VKIKAALGPVLTPKSSFVFQSIPRTKLGKPDRIMAAEIAKKIETK
jgi:hypothetical protein